MPCSTKWSPRAWRWRYWDREGRWCCLSKFGGTCSWKHCMVKLPLDSRWVLEQAVFLLPVSCAVCNSLSLAWLMVENCAALFLASPAMTWALLGFSPHVPFYTCWGMMSSGQACLLVGASSRCQGTGRHTDEQIEFGVLAGSQRRTYQPVTIQWWMWGQGG